MAGVLASREPVSIVGGLVAGISADGRPYHPVVPEARDLIGLLSDAPSEPDEFAPTDAQVQDALDRAEAFRVDWEIHPTEFTIRRRRDASDRAHSVLGLYWFCKTEWLENPELRKLNPPVAGDNQTPGPGVVRTFTLRPEWKVEPRDVGFLVEGPLFWRDQELVAASGAGQTPFEGVAPDDVLIGLVTALHKEHAAVLPHLQGSTDYELPDGSTRYVLGTLPARDGHSHKVALVLCGKGTNAAAAVVSRMFSDFPNLQFALMVGIAGGIPFSSKASKHVRLGDVVVSGVQGIVQYDFERAANGKTRRQPLWRIPGRRLTSAVDALESRISMGGLDWSALLGPTENLPGGGRPDPSTDLLLRPPYRGVLGKLGDLWRRLFGSVYVEHPADPQRIEGQPRTFVGVIASGNKLVTDARLRDQLRDEYEAQAIEMEAAGVAEAAYTRSRDFLVVRGTCDYCDSKKHKAWQPYAARVAAAYTVAVLAELPPS